jgi:hypothetical protein
MQDDVSEGKVNAHAFLSLGELGKLCPEDRSPCEWGAVSLCRSRSDTDAPRRISPRKFRNAKVAQGALNKDHGVTKPTPTGKNPSHTSYWPYDTAEPWLSFTILNDDDG